MDSVIGQIYPEMERSETAPAMIVYVQGATSDRSLHGLSDYRTRLWLTLMAVEIVWRFNREGRVNR